MSIHITAKKKPMPECQFCGWPLIKDYYEVKGEKFCKILCVQEYLCPQDEERSSVIVHIEN